MLLFYKKTKFIQYGISQFQVARCLLPNSVSFTMNEEFHVSNTNSEQKRDGYSWGKYRPIHLVFLNFFLHIFLIISPSVSGDVVLPVWPMAISQYPRRTLLCGFCKRAWLLIGITYMYIIQNIFIEKLKLVIHKDCEFTVFCSKEYTTSCRTVSTFYQEK